VFGPGVETCTRRLFWSPCEPSWNRRARLTLNATGIAEPLIGVPILVRLNAEALGSYYSQVGADGVDLLFVDADGVTELPFEIESWDAAGDSWVWVRVPVVDPGATDFIWLYFGNPTTASRANPTAVWDDHHVAVWHLAEDAEGAGTAGLYRDSTRHGHVGDDNVRSSDKTGLAGPGQWFAIDDRIVVSDTAALTPKSITLEMAARNREVTWPWRTRFTVEPATPEADLQVLVTIPESFAYELADADGDDLRFFDGIGNSLPYWIEVWDPGSTSLVWVKTVAAGTDTLIMMHGNPEATAASDAASVLQEGGLWLTFWSLSSDTRTSMNTNQMEDLFDSLGYASRLGWGAGSEINCREDCNPYHAGDDVYYALLAEGWVSLDAAGQHGFATNSNDASDVWVDETLVTSYYGEHTMAMDLATHSGTISLPTGLHRFSYRHQQAAGSDGWEAGYAPPGGGGEYSILPSTRFHYVKHGEPQPIVTLTGTTELVATRFAKGDSWVLGFAGLEVGGGVNQERLSSSVAASWHTLGLTYDGVELILYVDGTNVASRIYNEAIDTQKVDITVGDLLGDPLGQNGPVDELRISNVARHADWMLLQTRSLTGAVVTVGEIEQP
jgi:hypothetical protein